MRLSLFCCLVMPFLCCSQTNPFPFFNLWLQLLSHLSFFLSSPRSSEVCVNTNSVMPGHEPPAHLHFELPGHHDYRLSVCPCHSKSWSCGSSSLTEDLEEICGDSADWHADSDSCLTEREREKKTETRKSSEDSLLWRLPHTELSLHIKSSPTHRLCPHQAATSLNSSSPSRLNCTHLETFRLLFL